MTIHIAPEDLTTPPPPPAPPSDHSFLLGQGVACSKRPEAMDALRCIDPLLGAITLEGEADVDFALPGALPLVWQRRYSSYVNVERGGECGALGYGWRHPLEWRLEVSADGCLVHDLQGRTVAFDALAPGQSRYSASEDLWLLRSPAWAGPEGVSAQAARWAHLPRDLVQRPHLIFMGDRTADVCWAFAPANRKGLEDGREITPVHCWLPQARIDRWGRTQRFRYRHILGQDRLVEVRDGLGRWYHMRYEKLRKSRTEVACGSDPSWGPDSGVRLTAIERMGDPVQRLVRYVYNAQGDLVEVHNRHGECTRRFAYANHLLVLQQERDGPEHSYRHERHAPGARVVEQRSQQGLQCEFGYAVHATAQDVSTTRTVVTDSLQRREVFVGQGQAGLARCVEHIRRDGGSMQYRHDVHGRCVETVDSLGRTTRRVLSDTGLLQRVEHPDGSSEHVEWNTKSALLQSTTDAEGRKTRYQYDRWHRLVATRWADGRVELRAYPVVSPASINAHLPTRITNRNGRIERLAYTREGLLRKHLDASGHGTEWEYTDTGLVAQEMNAIGEIKRFEYTARGQLESIHHGDGKIVRYTHDARGRITLVQMNGSGAAQIPNGRSALEFQYDLWGRITARTHAGATQYFEYDAAGRMIALVNENGDRSAFSWDSMDRLIKATGYDQRVQSYRYNLAGEMTEWVDGSESEQKNSAHITRLEWNETGQLKAQLLPTESGEKSQEIRYVWSKTGELQSAHAWQHNAGEKSQALPLSQVEFKRERWGRTKVETQRLFDAETGATEFEFSLRHQRNAEGRRTSSETDAAIGIVSYTLNDTGAVRGVVLNGQPLLHFERDALQRETRRHVISAGMTRSVRWGSNGRWQHMQWEGDCMPALAPAVIANALSPCLYHYSRSGELAEIHSNLGVSRFAHDAHGRLIAAHTPQAGLQRWTFDPAGNVLPQPSAEMTTACARESEPVPLYSAMDVDGQRPESQLAHTSRWTGGRVHYYTNAHDRSAMGRDRLQYRYDSRGRRTCVLNLENHHSTHLTFDASGQLARVQGMDADGQPFDHHYRYDPLGRRLATYAFNALGEKIGAEYFGWDGEHLVRIERHAGADRNAQPELIHHVLEAGTGVPLVQLTRAAFKALNDSNDSHVAIRHFLTDHRGTPVGLLDDKGAVVWAAFYDPRGNITAEHNPEKHHQPIRFGGLHWDEPSRLHYGRQGYWDARTGLGIRPEFITSAHAWSVERVGDWVLSERVQKRRYAVNCLDQYFELSESSRTVPPVDGACTKRPSPT